MFLGGGGGGGGGGSLEEGLAIVVATFWREEKFTDIFSSLFCLLRQETLLHIVSLYPGV